MKKVLLSLLFLISILGFSQETKFTYKKEGLTDFVVTNVKGTAPELYSKAINWIKETYKNPDEVIKMTIVNEKIRIEGFQKNLNCIGSVCADGIYVIEISFRDERYKFDPVSLLLKNGAGSFEVPFNDLSIYYDKKGELKKSSKEGLEKTIQLFDGLNESLKNYIVGDKKSDW